MNEEMIDILVEMAMDDKENVAFGKDIYAKLLESEIKNVLSLYKDKDMVISKSNAKKEAVLFINRLLKLAVSLDHELNPAEITFYKETSGNDISDEEFYNMTNGGSDPVFISRVFHEISISSFDVQSYAFMYLMSFFAFSVLMSSIELAFLDKLFNIIKK